jgi:hypothetical protein
METTKTFLGLSSTVWNTWFAVMISTGLIIFQFWADKFHPDWLIDLECASIYTGGLAKRASDACSTGFGTIMALLMMAALPIATIGFGGLLWKTYSLITGK